METKLQDYIKALKYGTGSGWEPSREDIIELLEEIDKKLTTDWVEEACDFKDEMESIVNNLIRVQREIEDKGENDIASHLESIIDDIDDLID